MLEIRLKGNQKDIDLFVNALKKDEKMQFEFEGKLIQDKADNTINRCYLDVNILDDKN